MNNRAIGVFDSGLGGLSVLDDLIGMFPGEDFYYIADTKNMPYGTRDSGEIALIVSAVARYLVRQNVKAIVIACNTATAAGAHLHREISIPIVGVIAPTAAYAARRAGGKPLLILATQATVASGYYQKYLNRILPKEAVIYALGCGEFVTAIEDGAINNEFSYNLVREKLKPYQNLNIGSVILGCTHFGYYKNEISAALPGAKLIDCGRPTGAALGKLLGKYNILNQRSSGGQAVINTTGSAPNMEAKMFLFKRTYSGVNHIVI